MSGYVCEASRPVQLGGSGLPRRKVGNKDGGRVRGLAFALYFKCSRQISWPQGYLLCNELSWKEEEVL